MKILLNPVSIFFLLVSGQVIAQAPPSTDIFLIEMREGTVQVPDGGPTNLTAREGYDNQPFFTPDGRHLLYTSFRENQTDIYRIDLENGLAESVTATPESEYSPTVLPSGEGFSVIRVEADGTQRLWRFDMDGNHPALLLEAIHPVGYQAWVDRNRVAMFILGQPPTLQLGDLKSGNARVLADSIGRSLHRLPGSLDISFVLKRSEDDWEIRRVDPESGDISHITSTLEHREDYAWMPDGSLLMADGAVLNRWSPDQPEWQPLYDFGMHGLETITRIAVSPDGRYIAFVADR